MDDATIALPPKIRPSLLKRDAAKKAAIFPGLAVCLATTALGSCSPKQAVIPPDPHNWDQLANNVRQLSPDDSRLFTAFMSRRVMADALPDGRPNLPAGMTIGDAIDDERAFEARQAKQPAPSPEPSA